MPFRQNVVVAAVLQTANTGRRVVIGIPGALAATIQFFTGHANEAAPALIAGIHSTSPEYFRAYWAGYIHKARPRSQPEISMETEPTRTRIGLTADDITINAADDITINAGDRLDIYGADTSVASSLIRLKSTVPSTATPALVVADPAIPANHDILGAWTSYTPVLTASVTNPTIGAGSIWRAAYMKIGRTVHVRWRFICGAGWNAGNGTIFLRLPVPAVALSEFGIGGSGFIVNAAAGAEYGVNWTGAIGNLNLTAQFTNSPGAYLTHAQITNVGSQLSGSITYESAT